jgi:long-chain acyl-CoA synthetase
MSTLAPWLSTYHALGKQWQTLPDVEIKTLSGYIRDHACQHGGRTALVYLGRSLSYAGLDALADALAGHLRAAGVGRGDVLGLHLPNTPQFVVGLVAASRLGMIVTSLSPLLTGSEISQIANDAGIKVLLTLDVLHRGVVMPVRDSMPALRCVLETTATEWVETGSVAGVSVSDPARVVIADEAAVDDVHYLYFTGGTTGRSKGAQLSARNIFINSAQANVFYQFRMAGETVASGFPLFHIGGAAVMFNALRMAATFILIPDPRNVTHFCAEMRAHPPTVLANVPALYQMLLNTPDFAALDFSGLRMAVAGAAPFAVEEIRRLEAVIGEGKYCEVYGMTETGPVQTLNPAQRFKPGCVGIPLPGTDLRIVDTDTGTRVLPTGEAGEIIVSGPQVMRGYFGLGDASAQALREMDGKIWMHTGDIGVMDEEGYVRVCDRLKDMLIVGGYKVFSVEVEGKLRELPFIEQCAVVGKPDSARPGNEIVQLYVQLRSGVSMTPEAASSEISAFCRAHMAAYKVPKEIFVVQAIPLTSVGKIDKKALRSL